MALAIPVVADTATAAGASAEAGATAEADATTETSASCSALSADAHRRWYRLTIGAVLLALTAALLPPVVAAAHADTGLEAAFVAATNDARASQGLAPLSVAGDLTSAARAHSRVMGDTDHLHHNPNLGSSVGGWQKLGENVGRGPSVTAIHSALMNSPSHRANIVGSEWTQIGIGVVVVDGQIWVTQMFRQPTGASAPAPAPPADEPAEEPADESQGSRDSEPAADPTPDPPADSDGTGSSDQATSDPTTSPPDGDAAEDDPGAFADPEPHPVTEQTLALDRTTLLLARQTARDDGVTLEEFRAQLQELVAAA